jgi:creatinine amidohydrolase
MNSGYWQDLTSDSLAGIDPQRTVVVLPVAAVEQHGPHLPLATDAIINAALVEGMLARVNDTARVLVLPAMTVGDSLEHRDFAGTLSIGSHTLLAAWLDVAASVARCGVRKLVILNSHGGQRALVDLAAVRMRAELGMLVARANYFSFGLPEGLFASDELAHGIHGGEVETSLLLHLRPDLVRVDALQDFPGLSRSLAVRHRVLGVEKPVGIGWMSQDLNPLGVCGNAARADSARGAQALAHLCTQLVTLLGEMAALPLAILKG